MVFRFAPGRTPIVLLHVLVFTFPSSSLMNRQYSGDLRNPAKYLCSRNSSITRPGSSKHSATLAASAEQMCSSSWKRILSLNNSEHVA
uniref:Putative secreted peptide n=1 Tax=Anopheles braziliensis TaxID=58242 RepID=A0A2M3ZWA7_9DIPT